MPMSSLVLLNLFSKKSIRPKKQTCLMSKSKITCIFQDLYHQHSVIQMKIFSILISKIPN